MDPTCECLKILRFEPFLGRSVLSSHLTQPTFDFSHIALQAARLYCIQRFEDSTESSVRLGGTAMKRNLILLVVIGWMALTLIYKGLAAAF